MLIAIQALLSAPNVEDPLDEQVADHWKNDENGAIQRAREWTQQYASDWASVWLMMSMRSHTPQIYIKAWKLDLKLDKSDGLIPLLKYTSRQEIQPFIQFKTINI